MYLHSLSLFSLFSAFVFAFCLFVFVCPFQLRRSSLHSVLSLPTHIIAYHPTPFSEMFKSIILFSSLFALALSAPLPDGGSAYSGVGGSANGGSVSKSQK